MNDRTDDESTGPSLPSRIRFRKSIEHGSSTAWEREPAVGPATPGRMHRWDEPPVTVWLGGREPNVTFGEHAHYGCVKTIRSGSDSFRIIPLPRQQNDSEGV